MRSFVSWVFFSTLLMSAILYAQTIIPGGYVSGLWTMSGSPYLIQGQITVHSDSILQIGPGAEVRFQGHYKLNVNGILNAEGTEIHPIYFTAVDTVVGWHGIRLVNAVDSSHIFYCVIQYGRASGTGEDHDGGGIYCNQSHPHIYGCLIQSCTASSGGGGGIRCNNYANPVIQKCHITGCSSQSGGGIHIYNSSPVLRHNVIDYNQVFGIWNSDGGGIHIDYDSHPDVINNTISHNSCYNTGAGIFVGNGATPDIVNTIISHNTGHAGFAFWNAPNAFVRYCDVFGNSGGHFWGNYVPAGLGQIVGVNANGDPCDINFNIFLDPLFVGTNDYHLTENSPCIDAGDPLSPLDPDGTIADIGAFYFNQGPTAPCAITDLTISCDTLNAHLVWSPITTDTSGNPIAISRYVIYASGDPSATDSIGYTTPPDTSFTDTNALTEDKRFYNVKVIAGSR
jgi:hypothetical protein